MLRLAALQDHSARSGVDSLGQTEHLSANDLLVQVGIILVVADRASSSPWRNPVFLMDGGETHAGRDGATEERLAGRRAYYFPAGRRAALCCASNPQCHEVRFLQGPQNLLCRDAAHIYRSHLGGGRTRACSRYAQRFDDK